MNPTPTQKSSQARPTTTSTHTPEPWVVDKINPEPGIPAILHGNVAVKMDGRQKVTAVCGQPSQAEVKANARRIVACVNALAGITDPAAYRAAFDAMRAALRGGISKLEELNEEHCRSCVDMEDALALADAADKGAE